MSPPTRASTQDASRRLWAAYSRTTYVAHTEIGDIRLRPGRHNARLERLLALHRVRSWAFITAYNPGSIPQAAKANKARHEKLLRAVRRHGLTCWPGEGVGDDRRWRPEASLLILGVDEDAARAIGRRYGQVAILAGQVGRAARLVACATAKEV